MKFNGTEGEFVNAIDDLCLEGEWSLFELGLKYKTDSGLVIMWWEKTQFVIITGPQEMLEHFETLIEHRLNLEEV